MLSHNLREAMATEVQTGVVSEGHVEIDCAYFGGHIRPENAKADRKDCRLKENQTGRRRVVIVMREREGRTLPTVAMTEGEGVALALENGGCFVTWREIDTATGEDRIMAQDFGPNGGLRRQAFQVNAFLDGAQSHPQVTGLEDGGSIITWTGIGRAGQSPDGGYAVSFTREVGGLTNGPDIAALFTQGTSGVIETGGAANDLMSGGCFDDFLRGGSGNDRIIGREGADPISGDDGSDTIDGGAGDDFLYAGASNADIRDVIYGGDGNDIINGGAGYDELNGGSGNDTVDGDFGSDTIIGNDGNDLLGGSGGSDLMFGNGRNDTLNGGFDYDRLNGGAGADSFFHAGLADHGSDWVQDYNAAEGDLLTVGLAGGHAIAVSGQLRKHHGCRIGGHRRGFRHLPPDGADPLGFGGRRR